MTPETGRCIGDDYRLVELIDESPQIRRWLAEQLSVGRTVVIEELRPDRLESKNSFLNDVKAKGSVDHPWIGSVYEAVDRDDLCFFAQELLPGPTLAQTATQGETLAPSLLASIVRRVAETQIHLESSGRATSPISLEHIHIDSHSSVRVANLAVAGARSDDQSLRDVLRLGESLPPLLGQGQPGTTRMLSLFAWMRGEGIDSPIDWHRAREIAAEIEEQLMRMPSHGNDRPSGFVRWLTLHKRASIAAALLMINLGAVLVVPMFMGGEIGPSASTQQQSLSIVTVPADIHPTPDGLEEPLAAFNISAKEISIREYEEFLKTLTTLADHQQAHAYDHPDQPNHKTSHVPDQWQTMLASARSEKLWNQKPLTLASPVVGIDWWDAVAYANWKQANLPSQEQWHAAKHRGLINGTVEEWTNSEASPPDNPHGSKRWVVIGPAGGRPAAASPRQWTDDRMERHPERGFRIVIADE
jgi:hypothetical protein